MLHMKKMMSWNTTSIIGVMSIFASSLPRSPSTLIARRSSFPGFPFPRTGLARIGRLPGILGHGQLQLPDLDALLAAHLHDPLEELELRVLVGADQERVPRQLERELPVEL